MTDARSPFVRPDWVPSVAAGARILVVGASGGLGGALVDMLCQGSDCVVGAHGDSKDYVGIGAETVVPLRTKLTDEAACIGLIEEFCDRTGGFDGLVVLAGGLSRADHWDTLTEAEWRADMHIQLDVPFFLGRAAMRRMKAQGDGGRIVLNGTESALHGGSAQSFPYAIAKRGIECMVQGFAREGAPTSVLVNGVRLGYIASGFHQRWSGRTDEDLANRAQLVPLKRGGHPDEAAALIVYLLSGWSSFITGQMFALTGGDWL